MRKSLAGRTRPGDGWRHRLRRLGIDLVCLVVLTLLFRSALAMAGGGDAGICANTGVTDAYQPQVSELSNAIQAVGSHTLGPEYEETGQIWAGTGEAQTSVPATFPCAILSAVAYVESSWHQAYAVPRGSTGLPLVSSGCGYGIMQITSPMISPGAIDPAKQRRVAREYRYNLSYGAMMLAQKWNSTPVIGGNNPAIAEDWYYAVWSYNNWSWKNNPNNPTYNPSRPLFNGSQPRQNYPYQELVWGFAANPPAIDGAPRWNPLSITLPPNAWIANPPGTIPDPSPVHASDCANPPPPTATPPPVPTSTTPMPTPTPTATPRPILSVSSTTMGFLAEPGQSAGSQSLRLYGDRGPSLNWSIEASSAEGWLSTEPTSGNTVPALVTVSAFSIPFPNGQRSGTLTIRNQSNPAQPNIIVSVSMAIGPIKKIIFPVVIR